MTEGAGRSSGWEDEGDSLPPIIFDDDFVRAATIREPSARARMLAAQWRDQPPETLGWRQAGPIVDEEPPPEPEPPRRRRHWWKPLLALVVVLMLLASVVANWLVSWTSGSNPQASGRTPVATPDDPFAGSPAQSYGSGLAGIMLPAARPVRGFTAAQISSALELARRLLAAGNLDQQVLRGGQPTALLALLDAASGQRQALTQALLRPSAQHDPTDWVTRFDLRESILVGDVVKVNGAMTYAATAAGALRVHADYDFVYAVRPAQAIGADAGDRQRVAQVVVHRIVDLDNVPHATPGTVRVARTQTDFGAGQCGVHDGFVHAFRVCAAAL